MRSRVAQLLFLATIAASLPALAAAAGAKVGGKSPVDPADETVLAAAAAAVDQFNRESNALFHHSLVSVETGTKQVVAGVLFDLQLLIGVTDCKNKYAMAPGSVPPQDESLCKIKDGDIKPLRAKILWQAWNKERPFCTCFNAPLEKCDCGRA